MSDLLLEFIDKPYDSLLFVEGYMIHNPFALWWLDNHSASKELKSLLDATVSMNVCLTDLDSNPVYSKKPAVDGSLYGVKRELRHSVAVLSERYNNLLKQIKLDFIKDNTKDNFWVSLIQNELNSDLPESLAYYEWSKFVKGELKAFNPDKWRVSKAS